MKPAKTTLEQVTFLKSRNLIFENELKAAKFIQQNSYYRLAGYWRKYQVNPDKVQTHFVENTTFEKIVSIYELDALLRNLLRKGIDVFEICFRSKFAYYMSHSEPNGQFLYLQQNSYNNKVSKGEKPEDMLIKINKEISRAKEKFSKNDQQTSEYIPIWVAIEMLSFNTVLRMYSRWANREVNKKVSSDFKLFKGYDSSMHIIHSLDILRDLCVRHERIWNRRLIDKVMDRKYLQKFGHSDENSQWRVISILMSLVDEINENRKYSCEILKLCVKNGEFYKGLIEPT
jgi:abortive infection bacteriophage resistance protein